MTIEVTLKRHLGPVVRSLSEDVLNAHLRELIPEGMQALVRVEDENGAWEGYRTWDGRGGALQKE